MMNLNDRCQQLYQSLSDSERPLIIITPHDECAAEYDPKRDIITIDWYEAMDDSRRWSLVFHEWCYREIKNLIEEKTFMEIGAENRESFNELVSEAFSATLCHRLGIFPETKKVS